MRHTLLVGLVLVAMTAPIMAVSPSGKFQQLLPPLQRQGRCEDLPIFGVNTHRRRNPDDVNIRLISQVGARMVRLEMPWSDLERNGRFEFSPFDNLIDKLRQGGKSIIFTLAYGHPDHSDGTGANGFPLPPRTTEQRAAYGRYVREVAARYHGPDIVYEIWNEPNYDYFWPPAPDVKSYGLMLAEATQAIRAANPEATIITGGLANENDPPSFLRALSTAGELGGLDGIAFHPYRRDGPENSLYDISQFGAALTGVDSLPLWITEWGYSDAWFNSLSFGHVRERSAIMTARLMLTAALAKVKAAITYDLIDDGQDPGDQELNFGLFDFDFKPKPAATAFYTIASLMSGCDKYEFAADIPRKIITATFHANNRTSYVIWTYAPGYSVDLCFPVGDLKSIQLKDLFGIPLARENCSGASNVKLHISESAGPLILEGRGTAAK